jgi:hypothetical protein
MWATQALMKKVGRELRQYGPFEVFTREMMTMDEIRQFVSREPMR